MTNNSNILSNIEKDTLRQLEYYKNYGGKYLYAVKSYGTLPFCYTIYSDTIEANNTMFVANIYGKMVESINKMFRDEIERNQTVFNIDDILKRCVIKKQKK